MLAPIRQVVAATVRFVSSYSTIHAEPQPNSVAAREVAAEREWATTISPNPVVTTHSIASIPLQVALDHLGSHSRLLRSPLPAFAGMTMMRVVLDATARAWWLFDADIDFRERHRRVLNERLHSFYERLKLERDLEMDMSETQGRISDVREHARRLDYPVAESGRCVGQGRPSTLELVQAMHDDDFRQPAVVIYRSASAIMHSVPWGVMQMVATGAEVRPGVYEAETRDPAL